MTVTELPDDPLTAALLDLVFADEAPAVANHSVRSYLFARLLAAHEGLRPESDYQDRSLFAACVLHDVGLTAAGDGDQRFEVDGADSALEILDPFELPATERTLVWQAIALHTSPGIAERFGPLAYLVREGVGMDFGRAPEALPDEQAAAVHARYPRGAMVADLVGAIVGQADRNLAKAPRYSCPGELLRERQAGGPTSMEAAAAASRWGS